MVRVDRRGAEADERGHVVDLACITGFDDQAGAPTGLLPDQVMVDRRRQQQRRDRRERLVGPRSDRITRRAPSAIAADTWPHIVGSAARKARAALRNRVQAVDVHRREARALTVDLDQSAQVVVVQDRAGQHDLAGRLRRRVQQVALAADALTEAGDDLLADGVQRRVGHLREQLLEVVEQQSRASREDRDRVSVPIEPIASAPVTAIGFTNRFKSSLV